jgi:stage V sporulation protein B
MNAPSQNSPPGASATEPKAVGAGRGLFFITLAKLWFMVAGYAIQFALPRALGSPAKYGAWGIVLACVSLFNNVMVTGTIQAVSRFVAQAPARAGVIVRAALGRQMIGGALAAAIFILGAPIVAEGILRDPAYTAYLRVAGIVTFAYAIYAVFVGAANGLHQFHKQAGLDVSFATLRASFVIGAALLTHSVLWSLWGFAAASVVVLGLAALWVGVGAREPGERFDQGVLERYFAQVASYLVLVNLLMFIDGLGLKRWATIAGGASAGDTQAGFYNAVQTIARLPYQLILAVTFVIFPMMSRAALDTDGERSKRYVVTTMRYSLIVVGLMSVVLAARPAAVIRLLFPAEYAQVAAALPILIVGYVAFSLFNILGTILNAAGDTRTSFRGGIVTVVLCVVAVGLVLSNAAALGLSPSVAAACATTLAMTFGMVLAAIGVKKRFGAVFDPASALRVLVATGLAAGVAHFWPSTGFLGGKVGTLLSLCVIGAVYLIAVSRDLHPSELRRLRQETRG